MLKMRAAFECMVPCLCMSMAPSLRASLSLIQDYHTYLISWTRYVHQLGCIPLGNLPIPDHHWLIRPGDLLLFVCSNKLVMVDSNKQYQASSCPATTVIDCLGDDTKPHLGFEAIVNHLISLLEVNCPCLLHVHSCIQLILVLVKTKCDRF